MKDVEYRGGPGAVAGSRVRHRVSMIPVGGNLKDKWALSQKNSGQYLFERLARRHCYLCLDRAVVNSKSCCLPYCKHVHAFIMNSIVDLNIVSVFFLYFSHSWNKERPTINPDARDIVATLEKVALSTVMPLLQIKRIIPAGSSDKRLVRNGRFLRPQRV